MNLKILGIKFFFVLFVFSSSTLPALSSQEEERLPEQGKHFRDFHSEEPPFKRPRLMPCPVPCPDTLQCQMNPNADGEITLRDNLALALGQFASDEYLLFLLQTENNIPKDCVSKIFSAQSDERSLSFLQYIKRQKNWASIQEAVFPRLREFWSDKVKCVSHLWRIRYNIEEVLNGPYSQLSFLDLTTTELKSLSQNTTLTSLQHLMIDDDSGSIAGMLAWVLNANKTLRSLEIGDHKFSINEVWTIFKGLEHNTTLRDLRFCMAEESEPYKNYLEWGKCLSKNQTLTSLDVSFVPFNAAAALLTVPTLRCLAINSLEEKSAYEFELNDAANFLPALEQNTTLQSLKIYCLCLEGSHNDNKPEKLEFERLFANALLANTTITSLTLGDMWISDIGERNVFDAIKQKTTLTELSLTTLLRGQQIKDLAHLIRNSPNLMHLSVQPEFDPESAIEFCNAVIYSQTNYKTLKFLDLRFCKIPESCFQLFSNLSTIVSKYQKVKVTLPKKLS